MHIIISDSVQEFIEALPASELAKVLRTIDLLERFGHELGLPHSRHMDDGLLELRVRGKRELRFLYCFHDTQAVMLHAFFKKTQKTPRKEIARAISVRRDLRDYNI